MIARDYPPYQIITINSKGNIWHHYSMGEEIKDNNQNQYGFYGSMLSNFISSPGNIVYGLGLDYTHPNLSGNEGNKDALGIARYYYQKVTESPYFLPVNDYFSDKPTLKFGFNNFYKRLSDTPDNLSCLDFYRFYRHYGYVFSPYSDKILVVSSNE